MHFSKISRVLGLAALGAASFVLVGCDSKAGQDAHATPPPTTVTVAPVVEREQVEYEEVVGRADAVEHVEIRPRVSGYVEEVRFKSGQKVKKDDVLFVIDRRTRQAVLDRAEADVQRATVQFENAQRESARTEQLLQSKAISVEEADTRTWKLADAKAALAAAKAARDTAQLDLEFCEVKSPIDGQVSRAMVTLGNNVSGVDGATTLLTTVVSTDPIYVLSDVDEATVLRFKRLALENKLMRNQDGLVAVEMGLGDEKDFPRKGHIESVDNVLNPNTGSIVVRTQFPNKDGLVLPGMFCRVRIPVGQPQKMLFISDRAIGTDQSQKFVLSLTSSNTVAYRPVVLGPSIDGMRVIQQGLKPGEQIVVNGQARVRPGMPVTPEKEAEPKLQASAH